MTNILIDTDVLLDFLYEREPFCKYSAEILNLCDLNKISGWLTPVILSNVYYILRKSHSHNEVVAKLRELLKILNILSMDKDTVLLALNSEFTDFEDALQNYAAEHNGEINFVITRNIKDYRNSLLEVLTPNDFLSQYKNMEL
jgi:predicted nucleic acid-binding protein